MRAVKGSLGHSPRERYRESEGPRWTRAVEDQSAPIPKEVTSELGGINCNLARRPQWDQHGCHSKREKLASLEGRERSRQTILLARRTRTMRQCSSDARSEGQSGDSFGGGDAEQRRPSPGLMARPGKSIAKQSEGREGEKHLPVGMQVRKSRALGVHLARPQGRR